MIGRDWTGNGKTLAYTLLILEKMRESEKSKHPRLCIIAPTRELTH